MNKRIPSLNLLRFGVFLLTLSLPGLWAESSYDYEELRRFPAKEAKQAVAVDANGELGTNASSLRFKEAVEDMGEASDALMRMRPVVFRFREETGRGQTRQYGLIAEEVAEVIPELVVSDTEGRPYAVRYHVLPSMLLNEAQKQQRTIEGQRARLELEAERNEVQEAQIATLLARLDALESQLGSGRAGTDR